MQELTEHITKLTEQVASEKNTNEQLRGKVTELEDANSAMRSKLLKYIHSSSEYSVEQAQPSLAPHMSLQHGQEDQVSCTRSIIIMEREGECPYSLS